MAHAAGCDDPSRRSRDNEELPVGRERQQQQLANPVNDDDDDDDDDDDEDEDEDEDGEAWDDSTVQEDRVITEDRHRHCHDIASYA